MSDSESIVGLLRRWIADENGASRIDPELTALRVHRVGAERLLVLQRGNEDVFTARLPGEAAARLAALLAPDAPPAGNHKAEAA